VTEGELILSMTDARVSALDHYAVSIGPRDFLTKPEMRFLHQYNTKTKIRRQQLRNSS